MSHDRSHSAEPETDASRRSPGNERSTGAPEHVLVGLQRKIGNRAASQLVQRSLADDLLKAGSQLVAGGGALSGGGAAAGGALVGQAGSALMSAGTGAKAGEAASESNSGGGMGALAPQPKRRDHSGSFSTVAFTAQSTDNFQRPRGDDGGEWGENLNAFARESPGGAEAMIGGGGVHEDAKDQLRWGLLPGSEASEPPTAEEQKAKSDRQGRLATQAGWDSLPFAG